MRIIPTCTSPQSSSLEYEVQQNCNLTQVGGVLGSKGYGIALRKRSKWTDRISRQILDMAERGIIEMMKTKWWRSKGGTCSGTQSTLKENRLSLNMENVSGLFVVMLCGLLLAVVSVVIEFCVRSKLNAQLDKTSMCSEIATELKFALRLHDPFVATVDYSTAHGDGNSHASLSNNRNHHHSRSAQPLGGSAKSISYAKDLDAALRQSGLHEALLQVSHADFCAPSCAKAQCADPWNVNGDRNVCEVFGTLYRLRRSQSARE